jgi:hypothetical protein
MELQKYNNKVTINKLTMVLHTLLVTLQSLVVVFSTLLNCIRAFYKHSALVSTVLIAVDLIVQLMICYICLTMGFHIYLRKFQMTLDLTTGVPKVMLTRIKESMVVSELEIEESIGD